MIEGKEMQFRSIVYPEFEEQIGMRNTGKRTANSGGGERAKRSCLRCGIKFPSMNKANRKCAKCALREGRGAFGILGEQII